MKAVITYNITKELKRKLTIEKEKKIDEKQKFVFDTNEIEGAKEILTDIALLKESLFEGSALKENDIEPYFSLHITHSKLNEILSKKNILSVLEKEKEYLKKTKLLLSLDEDFYKKTGTRLINYVVINEQEDEVIEAVYSKLLQNYEKIKPLADEIQKMVDDIGKNFGSCCRGMIDSIVGQEFVAAFLENPQRAEEVYSEYKEKYQEILEERKKQRELFIQDRIKRGFSEGEAKKIADADKKERFEIEKRLWAEKFGSEWLKKGIEDGYNMNRVYHEERYAKEYGDGRLTDEWHSKASNPSLENLKKLEEIDSKYILDDVEIVWNSDDETEVIEIEADWAKKYWILKG